ncbi:tetratricopeptide repeat protein [Luteolibacter pohnpeiensis]|uniref:Tetratricopeptide repeat protein n=1 Tax=Luteolibacter pohnpeiensis TaxID=454153 RepID=A0A934S8K7_9BACT|nr:tetratricopeptide repeat protein [Luteolibacter pohnpeiensis]MBK1881682.1 tetratricopeptide repeat protein [Luteolibacter pohnpeiensis]
MSLDRFDTASPFGESSLNTGKFEQFMDRHQKGVAVLAVVAVLGAASFLIYRSLENNKEITAGEALVKAEKIADFQAVIKESPDTTAAGSAMMLLADQQWTEGNPDDSVKTLKDFLSSHPDHPAKPTAKASLASKLVSQGKSDEAKKLLEELVADPSARYIAPYALISLGDISKVANDLDQAQSYYERARNEYPSSSFFSTANDRISSLKAKPPVEIDAPPAPDPTLPTPGNPTSSPFLQPSTNPPAGMFPTEGDVPADPTPEDLLPTTPEPPTAPELPVEPTPAMPGNEGNPPSGS